jgi:hypothetical protein
MRELILDGKIFSIFGARALHEKKKKKKKSQILNPLKKLNGRATGLRPKKKKNVIREK